MLIQLWFRGVDILANTVKVTSVKDVFVLEKSFSSPLITNDGDHCQRNRVSLEYGCQSGIRSSFKNKWYRRWQDSYCNCLTQRSSAKRNQKRHCRLAQSAFVVGLWSSGCRSGRSFGCAIPVADKEAIAQVAAVSSRSEKVAEYISEAVGGWQKWCHHYWRITWYGNGSLKSLKEYSLTAIYPITKYMSDG